MHLAMLVLDDHGGVVDLQEALLLAAYERLAHLFRLIFRVERHHDQTGRHIMLLLSRRLRICSIVQGRGTIYRAPTVGVHQIIEKNQDCHHTL
jgi:hypothetical protein